MKQKVVIIGCGVVGATIAYELSLLPNLEITVLEKDQAASGATGAALGLLMGVISGKTKGRAWQLRENSLKRYPSLLKELAEQTEIMVPVNQDGLVKLLFSGDTSSGDKLEKWQKLQQTRQEQNWNLDLWSSEELAQKFPQLNLDNVIGGVYSPQDTQIHPQLLTKALVAAAQNKGVNFQFGVKVAPIPDPEREQPLREITTSQGIVEFDNLIIAAGLGANFLTIGLTNRLDIRPVLGQATRLKLEQELGISDFQPVITGQDIHLVPLGNQEYWLGATVEFPDDLGEVEASETVWQEVKEKAIAFCPAIADAQILDSWQGKRPRPYGQPAPIIGKLAGYRDVILATAHYRNGVLLAPGTAQEVIGLLTK